MYSIEVSNLSKKYRLHDDGFKKVLTPLKRLFKSDSGRSKSILNSVSFSVKSGEALGIMGINGAGKSTLLKILAGTVFPTSGEIKIAGKVSALLELGTGFINEYTGRENIVLSAKLQGIASSELEQFVNEAIKFSEIGDYIDQPIKFYSSGMYVRLAFSAATMVRPDVLIVDEALAVGDAYFQAKCYERISKFRSEGMSLLLVSHSPGDITRNCERAILLVDGKIFLEGAAKDVTNCYLDLLFSQKNPPSDGLIASSSFSSDDSNFLPFEDAPYYRKDEHVFGNGKAKIISVLVENNFSIKFPEAFVSGERALFKVYVDFFDSFESIVPGFLIKSLDGLYLYGTNSYNCGHGDSIKVEKGSRHQFNFEMNLKLNQGSYLVSFGISSGDPLGELVPLQRRYDSMLITVTKDRVFWGLIDLDAAYSHSEMRNDG